MKLFDKLADYNNTIFIIEHNLDIVSQSDWIIHPEPGAGDYGRKIIFEDYPKNIIKEKYPLIKKYLKEYLD